MIQINKEAAVALNVDQILAEIIHECFNGCTDERSTYEHFVRKLYGRDIAEECRAGKRPYPECDDLQRVHVISRCINYAAVRENNETLFTLLKPFTKTNL